MSFKAPYLYVLGLIPIQVNTFLRMLHDSINTKEGWTLSQGDFCHQMIERRGKVAQMGNSGKGEFRIYRTLAPPPTYRPEIEKPILSRALTICCCCSGVNGTSGGRTLAHSGSLLKWAITAFMVGTTGN